MSKSILQYLIFRKSCRKLFVSFERILPGICIPSASPFYFIFVYHLAHWRTDITKHLLYIYFVYVFKINEYM